MAEDISQVFVETTQAIKSALNSEYIQRTTVYMLGKTNKTELNEKYKVRDITLTPTRGVEVVKKIITKFVGKLEKLSENEVGFTKLGMEKDESTDVVYNVATDKDKLLLNNLRQFIDRRITYDQFLKSKFKQKYFVVSIPLNAELTERIVLFKRINQSYEAKAPGILQINLRRVLERRDALLEIVNPNERILLNHRFDFFVHVKPDQTGGKTNHSTAFIFNHAYYEDLFEYTEQYLKAYAALTSELKFIDWPDTTPKSNPLMRKCYGLHTFAGKETCIQEVTKELISGEAHANAVDFFKSQGIKYTADAKAKQIQIHPKGVRQLKATILILSGNTVTAHYTKLRGVASRINPY